MFGRRYRLFRLLGIEIAADLSWFLIVAFLTWSLAQVFATHLPQASPAVAWGMGLAGAIGLFLSVVLHEMAHALTARRLGLPIRRITLFIFGGVAEMEGEPAGPRVELLVAIAGPLLSLVLAGAFAALARVLTAAPAREVAAYLALINFVLVLFNLVPAFPLDGGRVLRSILWQRRGSLRWATRVTSTIGAAFGTALVVLGVLTLFHPSFGLGVGLWWVLIGIFVRHAAQMSYQQLLLRQTLEGEPVHRFMVRDPVTVPRELSVRSLVDDYVYRHHFKMYPVLAGGELVGCVSTRDVKALDPDEWERQSVGAIARPCTDENTIAPVADALEALARMSRHGLSRLMVVDGGRLVGILALRDLLELFALKVELGGEDPEKDGQASSW
jgi:Zn-dependent protease